MNAPKYAPTWNITTILAVANLAILVFMGGGAFFSLRAETQALREAAARLEAADVQIRLDATARETRLRVVEQGAGRMEERLIAIQDGINEIKRQLEDRP